MLSTPSITAPSGMDLLFDHPHLGSPENPAIRTRVSEKISRCPFTAFFPGDLMVSVLIVDEVEGGCESWTGLKINPHS